MDIVCIEKKRLAWGQFHQPSVYSFYVHRSQKRKKILMTLLYFLHFWDLRVQKLCVKPLVKLTLAQFNANLQLL